MSNTSKNWRFRNDPVTKTGMVAWYKYNTGITVTGSGVSQWDDQSGEGNHLKQATDAARPSLEADGSILFDGVAQFLQADAFTFAQPECIFILGKQLSWTANDRWFDGNTTNTGTLDQTDVTPDLRIVAGTAQTGSISPAFNTYVIVSTVFNGTSSVLQLNNETPNLSGDVGPGNMGGFTLGAVGGGAYGFSEIQVKEVILYNTVHDTNERLKNIMYLANRGGIAL